jgi:hypothetical protein
MTSDEGWSMEFSGTSARVMKLEKNGEWGRVTWIRTVPMHGIRYFNRGNTYIWRLHLRRERQQLLGASRDNDNELDDIIKCRFD